MTKQPLELLQQFWKHSSFRDLQEEIIQSVLDKKDTFALLPTGGGKSICFQIPALIMQGTCLVISPLVALMQDQVHNLNQMNIKAAAIIGGTSIEEIDAILDNCAYGDYKLLYLSPERLEQTWLLERIKNLKINLIAVDEAHCISQWGNDFRPPYLKISKLRELLPKAPIIALTGSANQRIIEDICTNLHLNNPSIFKKSFLRSNLVYGVYQVENKEIILERILLKNPFPSIVYVRSRKETQVIANLLNQKGFKATFFHGGLNTREKQKKLEDWIAERTSIIVATNAFGMGIDKKNVRNVVHLQIPDNIENYYQEAGRAGRDEQKAYASILLLPNEPKPLSEWKKENLFDKEFLKLTYRKLNNFLNIGYGEGYNSTHTLNFNRFCLQYNFPYTLAYNSLQFLDRQGIIKLTQNRNNKTKLLFNCSSSELLDFVYDNQRQEAILIQLIRNYPGIHEYSTPINLELISEQTDEPIAFIQQTLNHWQEAELCTYIPEDSDLEIVFNEAWEEDKTIYRTFQHLDQQNKLKQEHYSAMHFYAENTDICKNKIILKYFDEKYDKNCGTCSTCQKLKKNKTAENIQVNLTKVIAVLSTKPTAAHELITILDIESSQIILALQVLSEQNKIELNNKNQYILK